MLRVYNYMAAGVALTGAVAWLTFQLGVTTTSTGALGLTPFGQAIYGTPLSWLLMLAPLRLVFFMINTLSASTARTLFFIYAASIGLSALGDIPGLYPRVDHPGVLHFGGGVRRPKSVGLQPGEHDHGDNRDDPLQLVAAQEDVHEARDDPEQAHDQERAERGEITSRGVTAWDTQKIKEMYSPMDDGTVAGRKAVMGALALYLDFINLFLSLLRLFGDRRA
jgi:hypothetical protein